MGTQVVAPSAEIRRSASFVTPDDAIVRGVTSGGMVRNEATIHR